MQIKNGIDHLADANALLKGKRIGLITSSAGVTAELVHNTEIFKERGYRIECLLAPEHGIWGNLPAGELLKKKLPSVTMVTPEYGAATGACILAMEEREERLIFWQVRMFYILFLRKHSF